MTNPRDNKIADSELSLDELKAFILSIEWEISDEIMGQFIDEVESLKTGYKGDNVIAIFLKLLGIIGKYIRAKKVASHPDSIRLLNSVFHNLETIVYSTELDDEQKKRLLLAEAGKFKDLKEKIALSKTAAYASSSGSLSDSQDRPGLPAEKRRPSRDGQGPLPPSVLSAAGSSANPATKVEEYLLQEIQRMIHAEFAAMKAEIMELLDRKKT